MAPRKQGGSNLRGAARNKALQTPGSTRNLKGKWIEVSAEYRVLDALVIEKKITWTKSGRESAKRETELFDMPEKAATNEKREGRDRDKLGDKLEAFLTRKEEEDEATGPMEEMRKNVEAAQHKSFEAEQSLCSALREYVDSYDKDQGRTRTLLTKCWQCLRVRLLIFCCDLDV